MTGADSIGRLNRRAVTYVRRKYREAPPEERRLALRQARTFNRLHVTKWWFRVLGRVDWLCQLYFRLHVWQFGSDPLPPSLAAFE